MKKPLVVKWTDQERSDIVAMYAGGHTFSQIANVFSEKMGHSVSRSSIAGMIRACRRWSPREELTLRTLWGKKSTDRLCSVLGRSSNSISHKASQLGLPRDRPRGRPQKSKDAVEVPSWVPEIYRTSYAAIAAFEDEHEAAKWARSNMACDCIARKNGWLV